MDDRAARETPPDATGERPPAPVACVPEFPIPGWDRYRCLRFLGEGGMGQVFLARDPRLHRDVAIKLVHGDAPDALRRLVAEARAQARVSHDRVCKVYEVGEVGDQVYIAMQFIDGAPLGALAPSLTVEEAAMIFREAALGLHAAHQAGILHRDVKPSNILVERGDDRALRPYVVDFGIARDGAVDGATETGAVLGTPHYMAPEQARGELRKLDRRADVYSLGAALYHVLGGSPPIPGTNRLQILARIATETPLPLRAVAPQIPADLEAITMRCLEKDPAARYDSARAVADDLDRFLAGDPVTARRAGLRYRLGKQFRKHRRLVAASVVVIGLLGVALGWGIAGRLETAARARLAQRFTEQVERIEATARYAALSRLHDTRDDRGALRAAMAALDDDVRREGSNAAGPGHYALGRGHLALGDDAQAIAQLTQAWQAGFREPRVAYALALATGHVYQARLRELARLESSERREARRRELEAQYRSRVLGYLHDSAGADVPSTAYVAALIAFYEGRLDDALAHLDERGEARPWFYEAAALRGEILHARAAHHHQAGEAQREAADLDAGRAAFAAAAATGESDPRVHVALGELEASALVYQIYGHGEIAPVFERATAAATRALTAAPDDIDALVLRARLARGVAEYRGNRGEDVTALLTRATADATRATVVAPARHDARLELAQDWRQWGELRERRSQDPGAELAKAIEAARAIPPGERDATVYVHLGLCFLIWADYEDAIGADAEPHRSQAIEAYRSALRVDDHLNDAWLNLGINYYKRAMQPRSRDPERDLESALAAFERGRALRPSHIVPYFYGGQIHVLRARHAEATGGDPRPGLGLALASYRAGLAVNPQTPQLHSGIGSALLAEARAAWDRGADPFALLDQARAAYAQALTVAPKFARADANVGLAWTATAAFLRARGDDPAAATRQAAAAFTRALAQTPDDATTWANLAIAQAAAAGDDLDRGRAPSASLRAAHIALSHALARTARIPEVALAEGEVQAVDARWRARAGADVADALVSAAQAFDRAVALAPADPSVRVASASFCHSWAATLRERQRDPRPALDRGLAHIAQALAMRAGWPDALVLRARLLLEQADLAASAPPRRAARAHAAADLRQALAANVHLAARWRALAASASYASSPGSPDPTRISPSLVDSSSPSSATNAIR